MNQPKEAIAAAVTAANDEINAFRSKALKETERKYGKEMAEFIGHMMDGLMLSLVVNCQLHSMNEGMALMAFLETVSRWNEGMDGLVGKIIAQKQHFKN